MLDDRSHCQGRSRSGGGESGEGAVDEKRTTEQGVEWAGQPRMLSMSSIMVTGRIRNRDISITQVRSPCHIPEQTATRARHENET